MKPKLYYAAGGTLYEADSGHQDGGAAVKVLAKPNAVAPAGAGGECIFTLLYLTLTWTMATSVKVVPILDGVRYDGVEADDESTTIVLTTQTKRKTDRFEVFLGLDAKWGDGTVFGRRAMRGVWFTCEVSATLATGDLILENIEVETEVVREAEKAVA